MRLLHRDEEAVTESDAREPKSDQRGHDASDTTHRRPAFLAAFRRDESRDDAAARRDELAGRTADGNAEDHGHRRGLKGVFGRHDTETEAERRRTTRHAAADEAVVAGREERVETHMKRWDTAGFLTAGAAVALAVFGGLALARAGVDDSWYSPVVQVAQVDHTAALGAVEIGVAALVLIPLLFGLRMIAALVATAAGVVAAVAAIDPEQVSADLALERGWAIGLAVVGIALGLLLVATRDRVKRVERRPARAERHRADREARQAHTA